MNKFERMLRALPSFYRAEVNTVIRGLLQSWAVGDDEINIQIQNTKDQLFVRTGEGRFLNALGSNVGVDRSPDLGIDDPDFQNLIPVLSFYPKQVRETIIALLDVFWGPLFTRPNVNSGNTENFDFGPETTPAGTATFLKNNRTVIGVGTNFTVSISPGDYIKPTAASGYQYVKVARVLSATSLELSVPWPNDPAISTTLKKAPIRNLEYMVDSKVSKTLRFKPYAFDDITDITVQELVDFINSEVEHSTLITASLFNDPISGNKLNLRTNTPGLQGSIQILGGDANDPTRLNFDLLIHRETKANVIEINPNEVIINIPSSVPVLRRTLRGSAHPKGTKTEIFSNEEVFDFSGSPTSTLTIDVDGSPYTVTFTNATDFQNPAKVTAQEVAAVISDQLDFLDAFAKSPFNYKRVGLRTTNGSLEYQVTGGTANVILGFSTALQQDPDLIIDGYPSSYVFDPTGQAFTVTGINSELTSTVSEGSVSSTISLADASDFPNAPGKFILNFGKSNQEGPISYNSRPNNATLLIDASYTFTKTHLSGSKVNFVEDQPTIPRVTGEDYPVYIVGTEQAREAAQNLIRKLIAAGVVVRFIINFPEFLFECVCRECGPSESPDYRGSLTDSGPLVF